MYKRFEIHNFRGLRTMIVDDLRRVNLFVGPNNVGKTSMLELLWLLQGPGNPFLTTNLATFRGFQPTPRTPDLLWHVLFHNMVTTEPIVITTIDEDGARSDLRITLVRGSIAPITTAPSNGVANGSAQTTDVNVTMAETLRFEYRTTGNVPNEAVASWSVGPGGNQIQVNPNVVRPPSAFLSTWQESNTAELADRFTRVQDSGQLDILIESLRVLQPGLDSLSLGFTFAEQQPVIRGRLGTGPPIPLRLFGSGFIRLTEILLAVLTSGGGIVLVDEIEAGLYYDNFELAWKAIHTASRSADVQVFASTHSLECVQAAVGAFENDDAYQFRLYRLERDRDREDIDAIAYDHQNAAIALDMNLEVR